MRCMGCSSLQLVTESLDKTGLVRRFLMDQFSWSITHSGPYLHYLEKLPLEFIQFTAYPGVYLEM